jgi:D-methionine transport system substrate-binding protein
MKKVSALLLSVILLVGIAGCGTKKQEASSDKKVIKVGASPVPHAEILEAVKPILAKEGYTLKIVQFNDYVTPNTALQDGEIDANFFQHIPYLKKSCEEKKLDLDYTVKVHIEPMGVYSLKD